MVVLGFGLGIMKGNKKGGVIGLKRYGLGGPHGLLSLT